MDMVEKRNKSLRYHLFVEATGSVWKTRTVPPAWCWKGVADGSLWHFIVDNDDILVIGARNNVTRRFPVNHIPTTPTFDGRPLDLPFDFTINHAEVQI